MAESIQCPICKTDQSASRNAQQDWTEVSCIHCGTYKLAGSAEMVIKELDWGDEQSELLSRHNLFNLVSKSENLLVTSETLSLLNQNFTAPFLDRQIENLIYWLGNQLLSRGETHANISMELAAIIMGARNKSLTSTIISHLLDTGDLIGDFYIGGQTALGLSAPGWFKFEEIQTGDLDSKTAFVALGYNNKEVDAFVESCVRPAVKQTGFDAIRLDDPERAKAGLIDDRLRVEIRRSRFLIVDLTDENRGAYWEAGYGEGLGKPVIYTCKHDHLKDGGSHFDTSHHLHIPWDLNDLEKAADLLKACIRVTIPEAKQTDD